MAALVRAIGNMLYNMFHSLTGEAHAEGDVSIRIDLMQQKGRPVQLDMYVIRSIHHKEEEINLVRNTILELQERCLRLWHDKITKKELVAFTTEWAARRNIRIDHVFIKAMEDTIATRRVIEKKKKDMCSVCLDDYKVGEAVKRCPHCKNLIHNNCISRWLADHNTCPLCRQVTLVL